MASSPPPKGLPGFLRRSLRNPYDDPVDPSGETGMMASSTADERYGPTLTVAVGADGTTADTESVSDAETDTSAGPVVDEEEDLKREEEAVEAATNRINRKFRFGLSLGGSAGSAGGASGEVVIGDASESGALGEDTAAGTETDVQQDLTTGSSNAEQSGGGRKAPPPLEHKMSYKEGYK